MLLPLMQGAYTAQSIIANAQACINLYPEMNQQDSPVPVTHYPTPGLTSTGTNTGSYVRWQHTDSSGRLWTVSSSLAGSSLYVSLPSTTAQGIGTTQHIADFSSFGTTPVSMSDNGNVLIIVDNTPNNGWAVDLTNNFAFAKITDPSFRGATKVDYLETFFLFNVINSTEWYISLSAVNFEMLTGTTGAILSANITGTGNGTLTNGTFGVTLTGGTGSGASATLVIAGGSVTSAAISSPGINYVVGDNLTATLGGTAILTANVVGGSGYVNGVYTDVPLTGGAGSGAAATITVTGGAVTGLVFTAQGSGYVVGNVLTAALPGGSGFTVTVATVGGIGFIYTVEIVGGHAFDALDFVGRAVYADPLVSLIVMHAEIWLIGTQTSEIWYNVGGTTFPFQILPGVFVEHGCVAPFSLAKQDLSIYWISQDLQGQAIVLKGNGYAAHRISTFAIENEFAKYSKISDAVGWTYQQQGHTFYVVNFPTADKTWVWDESTQLWHQRASLQTISGGAYVEDGNLHALPYFASGVCGGLIYVGDTLGTIQQLDINKYTENTAPIPRIRSWIHIVKDQKRVSYQQFIADMECGTDDPTVTGDGTSSASPPQVALRYSDDRGKTFGNYLYQSLGALGQYLTNMQWQRLGMARDRVFELSWSVPAKTALNGAWVQYTVAGS